MPPLSIGLFQHIVDSKVQNFKAKSLVFATKPYFNKGGNYLFITYFFIFATE